MAGLTDDQIKALLSTTRTKGQYITYLGEFIENGEKGICANEEWVDLAEKKASTLKQGFENAKENKNAPEGAEFVKVIVNGDKDDAKVYLVNLKAAGVSASEVETDEDTA